MDNQETQACTNKQKQKQKQKQKNKQINNKTQKTKKMSNTEPTNKISGEHMYLQRASSSCCL